VSAWRRTVSLSDSTIGLRPRLAAAGSLHHRLAPPFEADARQHWLACHAARAAKLMIESQQRQKIGARRLGCEQRPEEAVAVGATHQVEHILMRCNRREVRRGHRGKRLACDR